MMTDDTNPDFSLAQQARAFVQAFVRDARTGVGSTAALMLLGGVLEGVGLILLVPLAGLLVSGGGRVQTIVARMCQMVGVETPLARLALLLAIFVLVMVARTYVLLLRDHRLAALSVGFVERLRMALIGALAGARWQDVASLRHARVTAAVGADVQKVAAATHYLLQTVVATVMLAAQWLLTLLIAPALALLALAMMIVGGLTLLPALRRAGGIGTVAMEGQARMMNASGQFLAGLKVAVAQNAQATFVAEFEEGARALSRQNLLFERRQSRMRVGTATVSALAGAGVLLVGMWQAVPVASLLVAIVALARMSGPAVQIQQAMQLLAHLLPAHTGIATLIRDLGVAEPLDNETGPPPEGSIAFDRVSFRHPDGGGVEAVALTLFPGEIVGVIGPSGAGKTTFVDLLAGLIEPAVGSVTIGGTVLSRRNAARFRQRVAYVGQDSFLVHDTIRRNLTLGADGVNESDLWMALERVGATVMVRGMTDGLDTMVAERGARLLGGERQRIALARALLRRPSLLILDEATNAIDVASERMILTSIAAEASRPTIVIVAHRTETLLPCDRVLRFAAGHLVEDHAVAPPGDPHAA